MFGLFKHREARKKCHSGEQPMTVGSIKDKLAGAQMSGATVSLTERHFLSEGLLEESLSKPLWAQGHWHCFVSLSLSVLLVTGELSTLAAASVPRTGAAAGVWSGSSRVSLEGESEVGMEGRCKRNRKWAQRNLRGLSVTRSCTRGGKSEQLEGKNMVESPFHWLLPRGGGFPQHRAKLEQA